MTGSLQVSVLVPTLRPDAALAAIDALRPQLAGIVHEFVVVCPYEIAGPDIRWMPEEKPQGSTAASLLAYTASSGDIVIVAGDDLRFEPGAIEETLGAFAATDRPFPMAFAYPSRLSGVATHFCMYGRLCPSFFAIRRRDAEAAGGFLDPGYRLAYADPDLGLRIWAAGGQVRAARAAVVHEMGAAEGNAEAKDAHAARDFERFRARWSGVFDAAWGDQVGGLKHLIAVEAAGFLGEDSGTVAVVGYEGIRDIRILHAITISAISHKARLPRDVLAACLDYLRWVSGLDADPLQVEIAEMCAVALVRGLSG